MFHVLPAFPAIHLIKKLFIELHNTQLRPGSLVFHKKAAANTMQTVLYCAVSGSSPILKEQIGRNT
jgi:hypothetical protein